MPNFEKKFIVVRENGIEVETSKAKMTTTFVANDLEVNRIDRYFKIVGIFETEQEAKEFFEKEKLTCTTSATRHNKTTYIEFDEIELFEHELEIDENGKLYIDDGYSGDCDFYIAPFKSDYVEILEG